MQEKEENSCLPGFGSKSVQIEKAMEGCLCIDIGNVLSASGKNKQIVGKNKQIALVPHLHNIRIHVVAPLNCQ